MAKRRRARRNPSESNIHHAAKVVGIGAAIGGGLGGIIGASTASGLSGVPANAADIVLGVANGAGFGASVVGVWHLLAAISPKKREEKLVTAGVGLGSAVALGIVGALASATTGTLSNAATTPAALPATTTSTDTSGNTTTTTAPAATPAATTAAGG